MFSTGAQAGTERSTKPGGSGILGGGPQTEDAKVSHVKSALDSPATVSGKPADPQPTLQWCGTDGIEHSL